jgi:FlaA1/EpsC-like NDP-sugar epimerase
MQSDQADNQGAPIAPRQIARRVWFSLTRLASDIALVWLALFLGRVVSQGHVHIEDTTLFFREFVATSIVFFCIYTFRRLDRIQRRYVGLRDAINVALVAVVLGTAHLITKGLLYDPVPLTIYSETALFGFFSATLLMVSYLLHRPWMRRFTHPARRIRTVVIVGAGDAGDLVARDMLRDETLKPVAFVDDDPRKLGTTIHRIPVLGTVEDLSIVVARTHADEVLIATPSANSGQLRRLYQLAAESRVKVRMLPPLRELISGKASLVGKIRDIKLEDLLNREPVKTDLGEIAGYIKGQRILITGAGGSIGSELARQVSELRPSEIILLGRGENSIYTIQQELVRKGAEPVKCVIADVRDRKRLEQIFANHRPNIVFHAAAHKHVPLMQSNPVEAVLNNIIGTQNVVECSARFGAERCIYISTDKAVEPTSIMGATKRVGEMIVEAAAKRSNACQFSCVRFGNVLGSRGSVVPLMEQQIKEGGPVTVTHPDMTRFFMTIPEAVSLILQAGAVGGDGDIFVLDMGTPVKIADMARDLILMHGLVPDKDIPIVFSGVRPGEKMHEVLTSDFEELLPTGREKLNKVRPRAQMPPALLEQRIKELQAFVDAQDENALRVTVMDLAWDRLNTPNPLTGDRTNV